MDISTQPCHRVKNASHDSTSLTQKTIQEKKKKMRKSIDWKVGIFGLIALILTLGLFSGSAQAAITGRVTSGTVIAGSIRQYNHSRNYVVGQRTQSGCNSYTAQWQWLVSHE